MWHLPRLQTHRGGGGVGGRRGPAAAGGLVGAGIKDRWALWAPRRLGDVGQAGPLYHLGWSDPLPHQASALLALALLTDSGVAVRRSHGSQSWVGSPGPA